MKRIFLNVILLLWAVCAVALTHVSFADVDNWTCAELRPYVGQEVVFDQPVYTCNNYSGTTASMHRQFAPTNQAFPGSAEYNSILSQNNSNTFTLSGLSGYQRMGQTIYGLRAKVNSTSSVTVLSYERITGTRADMEAGLPSVDLVVDPAADTLIRHDVLVCGANLEYYLVEQFDASSSMGPDNSSEHQKQRTKVSKALAKINADLYGLVEVQQGQNALAEIAADLTRNTGRHFDYVRDGSSANGTYTKSGYVYCTDVLRLHGDIKENNTTVQQRKKMQAFEVIASGERFIYSINHFKAKSSGGAGLDADQHDGQGGYNASRVAEAKSVLDAYSKNKVYYGDEDILVMGDLNAYGKEDPITTLTKGGMTDLHRYFHADSSYSYTYHGQAGYLDHALCNGTMLGQVTGMAAYHVNSDESDNYTYDKSSDQTMFRYSDHDPVLVGLKLGAVITQETTPTLAVRDGELVLQHATSGFYTIHTVDGRTLTSGAITAGNTVLAEPTSPGLFIVVVYADGKVWSFKHFVVR